MSPALPRLVAFAGLLALAAVLAGPQKHASALVCGLPLSAESIPRDAEAAFVGRIVWYPSMLISTKRATFRVARVLAGDIGRYVTVANSSMEPAAWWWGGQYVVFAYGRGDRGTDDLAVVPCNGSAPAREAAGPIIAKLGAGSMPPASPIDGLLGAMVFGGVGLLLERWSRGRRLET